MDKEHIITSWSLRRNLVLSGFFILACVLVVRAAHLQVYDQEFYVSHGQNRQIRTVEIPANRGDLLDRHGDPLAISAPVHSITGEPKKLAKTPNAMREVAAILSIDPDELLARIERYVSGDRQFIYLKRHVQPEIVKQVTAVADVDLQREYRRFYPSGSDTAHLVGFTGIDDTGIEGLELAYDNHLSGVPGYRRIVRDNSDREIDGLEVLKPAVAGKDLTLSIDKQLQYFASRSLTNAINEHDAESGSVVVLDVVTGEVMAMVNYPSYNPNDTSERAGGKKRNRAITDVFEPGSTLKPFTVAAALASNDFVATDIVNTSPGRYTIGKYEITDDGKDHGWLDLSNIVIKSSNVGISKIAQQIDKDHMWSVFDSFGFGRPLGTEFPGESAGFFNHSTVWNNIEQASVSYGYGISVSALQLARAYSALANDGVLLDVSFVAQKGPGQGERVLESRHVSEVKNMLERVVKEGTGKRAQVPGYRVAGKTGTSHLSQSGGYSEDRYISVFAGFAPVSNPRYAISVVVRDPKAGEHFGGVVAAPIFSEVMSHGLRLGGVEPDALTGTDTKTSSLLLLAPDGNS